MKYIDLTLPYTEEIAGFSFSNAKTLEKDGWNASNLQIYSHAGTHLDAPIHFGVSDFTVDQFIPEDFIAERAWVVDISACMAACTAAYLIEIEDLKEVKTHFQKGDSLLIRSDWYKKLGTSAYRNALPRISQALAHWMVENQVKIVGVEPPSVADVNNIEEVTLIHKILLGNVIIVEGLCHLDQITQPFVKLMTFPLKIKNGDGAPCRAIAIEV